MTGLDKDADVGVREEVVGSGRGMVGIRRIEESTLGSMTPLVAVSSSIMETKRTWFAVCVVPSRYEVNASVAAGWSVPTRDRMNRPRPPVLLRDPGNVDVLPAGGFEHGLGRVGDFLRQLVLGRSRGSATCTRGP